MLRDDAVLAVNILENLAKVSRFDLIIMCLSPMHKSGMPELATLHTSSVFPYLAQLFLMCCRVIFPHLAFP
jgi:hypothetical protein